MNVQAKTQTDTTYAMVRSYYDTRMSDLGKKTFHYASRMYLWTKEQKYKTELDALRDTYIGQTPDAWKQSINHTVTSYTPKHTNIVKKAFFLQKYPQLKIYTLPLFKFLFANSLYHINIRDAVEQTTNITQVKKLTEQLLADGEAIRWLATPAINLYYTYHHYMDTLLEVPLEQLWHHIQQSDCSTQHNRRQYIYAVTHCIIGESVFYSQHIHSSKLPLLSEMFASVTSIIEKNFFDISLDQKFEYLVCAKLLNVTSPLEEMINNEAATSLSPVGDYLVDTHNTHACIKQDNIYRSEHRNVLYLMSHTNRA